MAAKLQSPPIALAIANNSPEIKALLLAARTSCDHDSAEALKRLTSQPLDWPELMDLAYRNGVSPLLYKTFRELSIQLPAANQTALAQEFQQRTLNNLVSTQQLLTLINGLEQAGVLAVPFKGPVLAQTVYGDLALRSFVDLDLWIELDAVDAARAWLEAQGFHVFRELQWECHLMHPQARINVDLHYAVTSEKFPFKLTLAQIRPRLCSFTLAGRTIQALAPEDTLLVLCVGWCKDCSVRKARLGQLCDVAELLRSHPNLDWDYLLPLARRLDADAILLLPLALAHSWLGAPLPAAILSRSQSSSRIRRLQEHLNRTFWDYRTHSDRSQSNLSTRDHALYFGLRSSLVARIAYLTRLIIIPTEKEKQLFAVPTWLTFVYIPVRLVRLVRKYGAYLMGQ